MRSASGERRHDDGQLNLPAGGHAGLPGGGHRDYRTCLLSMDRRARSRRFALLPLARSLPVVGRISGFPGQGRERAAG